jgi:hypothetical protein
MHTLSLLYIYFENGEVLIKVHQWCTPDWITMCTYFGCSHERCHICELPIIEDFPMTEDVLEQDGTPERDREYAEKGCDEAVKDVSSG